MLIVRCDHAGCDATAPVEVDGIGHKFPDAWQGLTAQFQPLMAAPPYHLCPEHALSILGSVYDQIQSRREREKMRPT